MTHYDCPHCRNSLTADVSLAGQVVACPHCNGQMQLPAHEIVPGQVLPQSKPTVPTSFVTIADDGHVSANFNTVPQAKQALKELRLRKRQLSLLKRQFNQQQKAIRAQYTDHVRQRGSKFRGGGKIGGFIRAVQTGSRDATRAQLADDLAPLEDQKQRFDDLKNTIDQVIPQVEEYIVLNT